MKIGNRVGLLGLALLMLAIPLSLRETPTITLIGITLQWSAIGMFVLAGVAKPRLWLALPVVIVGSLIYLLSLGH